MSETLKVELTCPLGSKCEEAKDGVIKRCAWFTKLRGTDAQGVEHDEYACAIAWLPILQLEVAGTNRSVAAAVEDERNVLNRIAGHPTIHNATEAKVIKINPQIQESLPDK